MKMVGKSTMVSIVVKGYLVLLQKKYESKLNVILNYMDIYEF